MALPPYKVLGVVTITSGTPVSLAVAFAAQLNPSLNSCLVNTIYFQAHEGNSSADVYIGDSGLTPANDDTRGTVLATRQWVSFSSGANGNCLDPRDFWVDGSTGTLKVRVSTLKV
jgi:hypothetical protein